MKQILNMFSRYRGVGVSEIAILETVKNGGLFPKKN